MRCSYRAAMAEDDRNTKRLYVTLGVATIEHLELLARRGTHGTGPADVAKGLIEEGIRRAVRRKFLVLREDS